MSSTRIGKDYASLTTKSATFYYGHEIVDPETGDWCFRATFAKKGSERVITIPNSQFRGELQPWDCAACLLEGIGHIMSSYRLSPIPRSEIINNISRIKVAMFTKKISISATVSESRKIGDVCFLYEPWHSDGNGDYCYKAGRNDGSDYDVPNGQCYWNPASTMPEEAVRWLLVVTNIDTHMVDFRLEPKG